MISFWTFALGLSILLYVTLDGFDLGVGMLFPFAPNETARRRMLAAISPVWDGNETWLVIAASILFGIFPLVYATLLSALYLPLIVMLAALIFRGLAFEFRYKSHGFRRFWDFGFAGGSFLAGFIQGTAVGALVEGLAEVAKDPGVQRALADRLVGIGGDQDGRDRVARCQQVTMQVKPAHPGHVHVRDQTGGPGNLPRLQEIFRRRKGLGRIAQ